MFLLPITVELKQIRYMSRLDKVFKNVCMIFIKTNAKPKRNITLNICTTGIFSIIFQYRFILSIYIDFIYR